jgi:succinylglutamate desuccinylase
MKPPKTYLENPKTIKANKELAKVLNRMFGQKQKTK